MKTFIRWMLLLTPTLVFAQGGFQKHFSDPLEFQGFSNTADGGFLIAGSRFIQNTVYDFMLLKCNSDGSVIWEKTFPSPNDEFLATVSETSAGSILLGGYKSGSQGDNDFSVVKTNATGNLLWHYTYGTSLMEDMVSSGADAAGNFYATGNRDNSGNPAVLMIDPDGTLLWSKTFGSSTGGEHASASVTLPGGGVVVAGTHPPSNTFLFMIDASGIMNWSWSYLNPHTQFISTLKTTSDHGFLITGTDYRCGTSGCFPNFSFIRMDSSGNVVWAKAVEGYTGWGRDGIETSDGGFAFTGQLIDTGTGESHATILKTDVQGNFIWGKIYGQPMKSGEGFFIRELSDNGLVLFGNENSMAYLVQTDAAGNSGCFETPVVLSFSDMAFTNASVFSAPEINFSDSTGMPVISESVFHGTDSVVCSTMGEYDLNPTLYVSVFPNPVSSEWVICSSINGEATLYDAYGREVYRFELTPPLVQLHRNGIRPGIYFLRIDSERGYFSTKIVFE